VQPDLGADGGDITLGFPSNPGVVGVAGRASSDAAVANEFSRMIVDAVVDDLEPRRMPVRAHSLREAGEHAGGEEFCRQNDGGGPQLPPVGARGPVH
jgi:hypothetical protein